jgi:hypothetical protein
VLLRGEMVRRVRVFAVVLGAVLGLSVPAAHASDARHYEKVSPADKGNGDIIGDGGTNVASRAGDAVTLSTRTPFGDTIGSGVAGQTQYVARRTPDAWVTHAITPQPRSEEYQTFFGATRFRTFSDDLGTAVLWAYDLPAVTGDLPLRSNIYVEDTASRALEAVTALHNGLPDPLPHFLFELNQDANWGVSADARHVAFVSRAQYLLEAAPGVPNVYQWDDGVLSLAGVLPDGTVPPNGSDIVTPQPVPMYRSSMSADGSRLVFTASDGGNDQLFMRINGSRTVWVSEPELDPNDPSFPPPNYQPDPSNVLLQAVTPDGRSVFFTTDSPLLPEDMNGANDLYRYTDSADPSSDHNLTLIPDNGQVVGISDDGERVYTQTGGDNIVAWDHGTTHTIISAVPIEGDPREQLAVTSWGPGLGRLTPDGRYFAFATDASDVGIGPNGEVTNGHREMYLYTLGGGVKCISCPSGPATSGITVSPDVTAGVVSYTMPGIRPHFLSDDGKVFFSTAEALVPQDRNGVLDAYEYDPASDSLSLISSGKGSDPATFTDASASGDDVFIVTRQRLVASDHDDLVDLYDARIGDALPSPPEAAPPGCEGETCQGSPSASPPEDLLGSLTFDEGGAGAFGVSGLTVRRHLVLHGASGSLRVKLSSPGTLSWHGRGLRSGSVRRSRSGVLVLHLQLRRHARAQLRSSGTYRTSVHLTLDSADGDTGRATRVTFKAAAKKGR